MGATHLFQEGLLLPPMRVGREGKLDAFIEEIIGANVRNSDLFFGDMRAQLGVTLLGADRLVEVAHQVGAGVLLDVYAELPRPGRTVCCARTSLPGPTGSRPLSATWTATARPTASRCALR